MQFGAKSSLRYGVPTAVLFVVFLARVDYLSGFYADTYDEHAHIYDGLRWLETGSYLADGFHSPLPRLAIAVSTRASGFGSDVPWLDVVNWDGADVDVYERSLQAARRGTLPFAALLFWIVALWSRRAYGDVASLVAVGILSFSPTVLGHSALATLDIPGAAGVALALWMIYRWLDRPTLLRTVVAGLSIGVAQMLKFSAFGFLVPAVLFALGYQLSRRRAPIGMSAVRIALMAAAAFVAIWASYGFETGEIFSYRHDRATGEEALGIGTLLQNQWAPAPMFWTGFVDMAYLQALGYPAYFLGESGRFGWPLYFPVTLLLKATPPLLILAAWGFAARFVKDFEDNLLTSYLAVCAVGVLAVSIPSNVNIGIRHLAPLFPMMAMLAGGLFSGLPLRSPRAAAAALLLVWHVAESIAAHPHYIAYFTPFLRDRDYLYLSDSNLAWGQDRRLLAEWLADHPAADVYVHGADGVALLKPLDWENAPQETAARTIYDANVAALILSEFPESEDAAALRAGPSARIGRSYLVIDRER